MVKIEDSVAQLMHLAGRPVLTRAEHRKSRETMILLKEAGMTNEEISHLSNGRWSESTVKGYTKGIRAADPTTWQDAISLLSHAIETGMTLDDVETAVTVAEHLDSRGLTLDQATNFIHAAESASMDVQALIGQLEALQECDISAKEVTGTLNLKHDLERRGFGLDSLATLVELTEKYGQPQDIIEAISEYASLTELKEQVVATGSELEGVNQQLKHAHQQLGEVEGELARVREPLESYRKANEHGFGEAELVKLSALAQKHGGVKKVLGAVEVYSSYADITDDINKAKANLTSIKAKIGKLEAEYGHLKSATTMCHDLIHRYKFGLDATTTIFAVAKKYGDPVDVLKAVEAYGKLKSLQQELVNMEGKVAVCRELLTELEGRYQEALNKLESLNAMALKVGEEVGKIQSTLAESKGVERLIRLIDEPVSASFEENGPTVAALTASLLKWVVVHEKRFRYPYNIKSGLESLKKELGGI